MNATFDATNDLICPITLQLFRDPVLAGDGHIYEREAIMKWILEYGTSPLTRQPLYLHELRPDNHLRNLVLQQRNSTVSSNIEYSIVKVPISTPDVVSIIDHAAVAAARRKRCIAIWIAVLFITVPIVIFLGIFLGLSVRCL